MTADIVAYSAHPEDERLSIKVECLKCGIEFGWSMDLPAANERLKGLADRHNIEHHGHRRLLSLGEVDQ